MHTLSVFYRPDNYPSWIPWRTFTQEFTIIGTEDALDIGGVPAARPGFAPRIPFGKPPDDTDPTTGRRLRRGFQFQVKFKGAGHVVIDKCRIHAQRLIEKSRSIT